MICKNLHSLLPLQVDYFDLSREVVALSILLSESRSKFLYWYLPSSYYLLETELSHNIQPYHIHIFYQLVDRFFATGTIRPSSDSVLLVSIATLHIAIKIRESAIIKLSTLAWFGRGALYALLHFACWYLCTNAIHVWNQSIIS